MEWLRELERGQMMTAEDRHRVREALNERVRAQMLVERKALPVLFCRGCGMELDEWTPGCEQCTDRWWGYRRRGKISEQVYREKANAGKAWGLYRRTLNNSEYPRYGRRPVTTWQENREALGVKNGGRLVRTPRGLI